MPRLFVYGDSWRKSLDVVNVGFVHLPEELPCIGRKGLDVAPLTFGVDGVERERRLAGSGKPSEDYESISWNLQTDILEIVLAGPG